MGLSSILNALKIDLHPMATKQEKPSMIFITHYKPTLRLHLSKKRASDLLKALEIMLSTSQKPIVYGKNVISVEEGLWNT